jgi:SAM-dependent methyltransferase
MNNYTGTDNLEVMTEAVNYNKFLLSLIYREARIEDNIIDFGAGLATFAKMLAQNGYRVHCIEPDENEAVLISGSGLPVSSSLTEIADASVDFLYSFNVLEHIQADQVALQLFYRKMKPGSRLLIYVPAFRILFSSMDRKVGHYRRYSRSELVSKVGLAGFQVTQSRYVDCAGFFATLLYKMIGSKSGAINRSSVIFYDRFVFPISLVGDVVFGGIFGKNLLLIARRT